MTLLSSKHLEKIREQVINTAKTLAPTKRIKGAIDAKVTSRQDGWSIRWMVSLKNAPEARAYEEGSGIHAQSGPKKKYVIAPKNKKVLAFEWEKADRGALKANLGRRFAEARKLGIPAGIAAQDGSKFFGFSSNDNRLLFNWVEHPGVEAANNGRGYLSLAVEQNRGNLSETILDGAVEGIGKEIYKSSRFGFARGAGGQFVTIKSRS